MPDELVAGVIFVTALPTQHSSDLLSDMHRENCASASATKLAILPRPAGHP